MASCCPDTGHSATDHGMMMVSSDAGLVSDCDPVTTDGQSLGPQASPDPIAVGVDLLSVPVALRSSIDRDAEITRPRFHGPPVFLSTLRVRL
jgi:hypothetical protein